MICKSVELMTSGLTSRSTSLISGICGFTKVKSQAQVKLIHTMLCCSLSQELQTSIWPQSDIHSPHYTIRSVRKQPRLVWQEFTHHQLNIGIMD